MAFVKRVYVSLDQASVAQDQGLWLQTSCPPVAWEWVAWAEALCQPAVSAVETAVARAEWVA